jgi:hypothetical protein
VTKKSDKLTADDDVWYRADPKAEWWPGVVSYVGQDGSLKVGPWIFESTATNLICRRGPSPKLLAKCRKWLKEPESCFVDGPGLLTKLLNSLEPPGEDGKSLGQCECRRGFCCDQCYREATRQDPCPASECMNPASHKGPHGPEIQDQDGRRIVITAKDLLP